jgi:hypothetical protein
MASNWLGNYPPNLVHESLPHDLTVSVLDPSKSHIMLEKHFQHQIRMLLTSSIWTLVSVVKSSKSLVNFKPFCISALINFGGCFYFVVVVWSILSHQVKVFPVLLLTIRSQESFQWQATKANYWFIDGLANEWDRVTCYIFFNFLSQFVEWPG